MKPAYRLAALVLAALLTACQDDDLAGTSTETVAGKTTGLIFLADGKPARGAKVRVVPVGYQPLADTAFAGVFRTTTDDKGRYYLDPVKAGEYNILSDLDGDAAYRDSVSLSATARTLPSDTLEEPGSVSGVVALQPGDPLAAATVQVLGTQAYANVEDDGTFRLPAMAPGLYRAAVDADLEGYTAYYFQLRVRSGRSDILADTLRPRFTGIPVVTGLGAAFDTLKQVVSLTWSPTSFAFLDMYMVLRRPKGSVQGFQVLDVTSDTSYRDILLPSFDPFSAPRVPAYEYRVAIRDQGDNLGRTFGGVVVQTPPVSMVATTVAVRPLGARDGLASIGDTVRFVAEWTSSTRKPVLLRWFRGGTAAPIRAVEDLPPQGRDTLVFVSPSIPAQIAFRAEVADDGGAEWGADATLGVRLDPPWVSMEPFAAGISGRPLRLHAEVRDGLGRIVSVEWDIGKTGNWSSGNSNDTVITLPSVPMGSYPCIVRVTDDDGLVDLDTTYVRVTPWRRVADMPEGLLESAAIGVGGKLYIFGAGRGSASSAVHEYDPAADAWRSRAAMPRMLSSFALAELDGNIYVTGGRDGQGKLLGTADRYNPATDAWTTLPALPGVRGEHAAFAHGGRIHVLGGESYGPGGDCCRADRMKAVDVYDPATGGWSSFETAIPFEKKMRTAMAGNRVHVFSLSGTQSGLHSAFDPAANAWTTLPPLPTRKRPTTWSSDQTLMDFAVHAVDGRVIVAGGWYVWGLGAPHPNPTSDIQVFDPVAGTWTAYPHFSSPRARLSLASVGKDLYVLGGTPDYVPPESYVEAWPDFE